MDNELRKPTKWVRHIGETTIYCAGKDSIYVTSGGNSIIIQRWGAVRNTYKNWYNLRKILIRRNSDITIGTAVLLARKYGFEAVGTRQLPDFKNVKKLQERFGP